MPNVSRTFDKKHLTLDKKNIKSIVNGKWSIVRPGFTLIEILLALFIIIAILAIFFAASSTYVSSRGTNLQGIAAKIASCEIEQLRKAAFASIVNGGPTNIGAPCNQDVTKLPSGQATRTISDYSGNTEIKLATILVTWVDNSANKNIKMETLLYEFGL